MRLRPTIPIDEWRIATHLEASRLVQIHPKSPATGCECLCCRNWRLVAKEVLPKELQQQLLRFGIEVERPSDAYVFEQKDQGAHCRIVYHVGGKLLSGPVVINEDPKLGRVLHYKQIRSHPQYASLAVLPSKEAYSLGSELEDHSAGDLLQIELRLYVPWHPFLVAESTP